MKGLILQMNQKLADYYIGLAPINVTTISHKITYVKWRENISSEILSECEQVYSSIYNCNVCNITIGVDCR